MVTAVKAVLETKEDGLIAGGPPCGPWVFINSFTHGRKKQPNEAIFGDTSKAYVRASNVWLAIETNIMSVLFVLNTRLCRVPWQEPHVEMDV